MLDQVASLLASSGSSGLVINVLVIAGVSLGLLVALGRVLGQFTGHRTDQQDDQELQGFASINPDTRQLKIYHGSSPDRPTYTMVLSKRPANVQTVGGIVYVSFDRGPTEKYCLETARYLGSV